MNSLILRRKRCVKGTSDCVKTILPFLLALLGALLGLIIGISAIKSPNITDAPSTSGHRPGHFRVAFGWWEEKRVKGRGASCYAFTL